MFALYTLPAIVNRRKRPVDISLVIRHRLKELGLEQKDLAAAAQVTESYISQLLARKKAPPAPGRTDIYDKMGEFLRLPNGELSNLAHLQRQEELKKRTTEAPRPLFKECRAFVLRKCEPNTRQEVCRIFEKSPFGELERLVTQTLLDVAKRVAKEELESETWLRKLAPCRDQSYEEVRVMILEFLDTDVLDISVENGVSFLDPLIESWDINLETFAVQIALDRRLGLGRHKRFEFVEREPEQPFTIEPGFEEFVKDTFLSGDATEEEIEFLKKLKFQGKRPTPIYYYRELQNLRDPLHFRTSSQPGESN
jgi:hypothetical protein